MLLTARRLFTGPTTGLVEDRVLEIDDGAIVAIHHRHHGSASADLVDLGDVTLLPGLIDVHQHLAFDASADPVAQLDDDDDATLLLRMRLAAQRALAVGITTIRDLGDRNYLSLALRDWFGDGGEVGPRIIASGPPITSPNGHCWFLGGEADGPDEVRAAVRERVARGVDVIKVMASGGNLTPTVGLHESQLGRAELAVAAEEAHAAGLPLAVHAHGVEAVLDALAVGADSIEHCTFFTADGVGATPKMLEQLAASNCVISMTAAMVPGAGAPHPAIEKRLSAILANHATLHRLGARLVCSSDAGVVPSKPHDALPYGVTGFLPSIGMPNAEAIANVTAFAAEVCGVADRTGTLEVGKDADILAVAGNPLDDITALHDVVAVYARGRLATGPSHPHRRPTAPVAVDRGTGMRVLPLHSMPLTPITHYESARADSARIANGHGEAHIHLVTFDAGGVIGPHEAGFGQLFLVLDGTGWVAGQDGRRVPLAGRSRLHTPRRTAQQRQRARGYRPDDPGPRPRHPSRWSDLSLNERRRQQSDCRHLANRVDRPQHGLEASHASVAPAHRCGTRYDAPDPQRRTTQRWPVGRSDRAHDVAVADDEDVAVGVGHLERAMRRAVGDGGDREPLRQPLGVGGVDVVDHEIPADGTGREVLSVMADPEVGPAPHLEHREVGFHLHGTHADLFVEARRCHRVPGQKEDVPGPHRRTRITLICHEPDGIAWPASRRDVTCIVFDGTYGDFELLFPQSTW